MKKILVMLMIVALLVCSAISVSAATEDDLIAKLKEIPAANNASFLNGAIKLIKEQDFTEGEIDQLILILDRAKAILPENKGAAARNYTPQQIQGIIALLDEACTVTNYSYKFEVLPSRDTTVDFFNDKGELILEYNDGKVNATGVEETLGNGYIYLAAGLAVLVAAGAFIVIRKRENA